MKFILAGFRGGFTDGRYGYFVPTSGGGGSLGGGSVRMDSTLGQPITGVSAGENTWLGAGYWYAEAPVLIYLPMLRR